MDSSAFSDKKNRKSKREKQREARLSGKPYVTQKSKLQKPAKTVPKNEVERDFCLELVIDPSVEGNVTPSICWYNHGITVSGPNQEVRHYKWIETNWACDWSYKSNKRLYNIIAGKYEKCIAYTNTYEIVSFGTTPESQTHIKNHHSNFKDLCIVYPAGEFFVAVRNDHDLVVYNIRNGNLVSSLSFQTVISSIAENPELPCIAIGFEDGTLSFVSVYNESKPSVLVKMSITNEPLNTLKFFENGNIFVTGNMNSGDIFILKGHPGAQIEVAVCLHIKCQMADYILVASRNMMRFFFIQVNHQKYVTGNKIIRYCIIDNQVVNVKVYNFEDEQVLYQRMMAKSGADRDKTFYLMPFNTRYFEKVEITRRSSVVKIVEVIRTGHQITKFSMAQTKHYTITWGFDGFIFVRSLDLQKSIGMSLSHHRYLQGVRKAFINPLGTIIVSLGYDGVIAAILLSENVEADDVKQHIIEMKDSSKVAFLFKRPTLGFYVEERFNGKSWREIQYLKSIESDGEICRIEKIRILREFHDIRSTLEDLVTENFEVADNKKLDLLEFYLDTLLYNKKQQRNREECRALEIYLKNLIMAQDQVSDYIIKRYWEPMGVRWQNILGIFSQIKATNYCLLPENLADVNKLKWIEEQRKVEQFLTGKDTFQPWVLIPKKKLLDALSNRPTLPGKDYSGVSTLRRLQEIEEMDSNKSLETRIAIAGAISQLYIDISPGHYQQRQLVSFYQCELQQAVVESENIKLKRQYNKCFMNTRAVKEREMYSIKERNARLRHIISEYNCFSNKTIYIDIVDPEWSESENPETILSVRDDEVPVRPYISPSEQVILDAKAAEEERIRLLLLSDDFRERALQAMMNGALEIRWEDELKRDVVKPKCMMEKQPEEYNEEDLRAIHDYEEKVEILRNEREKYKSQLDVEFNRVSTIQRDSVRRFNQKLYECTKFKFYIDQATNQENLQVNRQRVNQMYRIEIAEKEREILKSISTYEKALEIILKKVAFMQEAFIECKVDLDTMQTQEKILEKACRREFMDMSPIIQNIANRFYKKRPKATYRNITSATILFELAKSVVSNKISFVITQDCLDYLKALDHLDSYSGVPPSIDEPTWALICKYRRIKIEFEIRLKACQIQFLNGEATISTFQKRVATKKQKIQILNAQLEDIRAKRLFLMHNKQIQIVLRSGLVEIPITGDLFTDFDDAILVPKTEIEHVNKLIQDAGHRKLQTIEQNLKFRRKMMAAEWEHMKCRMQINDLIEQAKDIKAVKLTKDMQTYLRNKSLGLKSEAQSYEMEVELLAISYENRIKDRKDKYKKIKSHIKAYKDNNKLLDDAIQEVNVNLCHFKLQKDWEVEVKETKILLARMRAMLTRNNLIKKIQENHTEILVLQTELELLRLRTFPSFRYKIFNE